MIQNLFDLMIDLVKSELFGGDPVEKLELSDDEIERLLKLSKTYEIVQLVADSLLKKAVLKKEHKEKLEKVIFHTAIRCDNLENEIENIRALFEKEKIPFILLKGSVLRKLYPEPWMRTSSDIDVLIREEDVERATRVLQHKSYSYYSRTTHDVSYFSPGGIHIELHYETIEDFCAKESNAVLSKVWENSLQAEGACEFRMTDEMFYFYHIAHMVKHFEYGGCGIRPFIDLYILNSNEEKNVEKREELLKKGGLLAFEKECVKLSECWFGNREKDGFDKSFEHYLINGGMYGSVENRVAIDQTKKGGKLKFILFRIFMPYKQLKDLYPVLEKRKWLTPFFEVVRWIRVIFSGRGENAVHEIKTSANMSEERKNDTEALFKKLELL